MATPFGAHLEDLLGALGSPPVFGVPGGQTLPLYGAAHESGRTQVVMRDERNAACAADAWARVTGKVGFCDATVGPGVTNLVSGLGEAYTCSIPIVALIADIPTDLEHLRGRAVASQAAPHAALLESVTKWFGSVRRPDALADVLDHAVRVAVTGRPGPVVVEIPEDIFLGEVDAPGGIGPTVEDTRWPRHRPRPDPAGVDAVVALLAEADKPVILAGGGVTFGGAAPELAELAERHHLPVVTTINGKGAIDERSPLAAGTVGMFGSAHANAVLEAADTILAIGTKLDQLSTHRWRLPRPDQRLAHVDIDGEELGRALPAAPTVLSDARTFAVALAASLAAASYRASPWIDDVPFAASPGTAPDDDRVAPEKVVAAIDELLGTGDLLVCDASLSSGWAAAHYRVKSPGVGMIAPRGLAGLGWSPGAAIGARLGLGDNGRVVALAGDGGFSYGLGEIETAVRLGLDLVYVVLNNSALGWIKLVEDQMGYKSSSDFTDVDFATVGRGLGATGTVVDDDAGISEALAAALEAGGTHVIDVRTTHAASPIIGYGKIRRGAYQ